MTTENDEDLCSMCRNTRLWHRNSFARHPFTPLGSIGELPSKEDDERPVSPIVHTSMPMDPVLRMAMIDKGLITTDDLSAAEQKIKFLTGGLSNDQSVRAADVQPGHHQRQ